MRQFLRKQIGRSGSEKRALRIAQASKPGIEFKASLETALRRKPKQNESAKTLEVDRPSKNLSEYKASLIAAKASRKRKAQR
jgi:hypothetical protein